MHQAGRAMPTDAMQSRADERLHCRGMKLASAARSPERAQLVWQRALELAGPRSFHDPFANALDLLRAAHHDPATMARALRLGHTELRRDSGNAVARAAAEVLEAAMLFIGVNPRTGDIVSARSPGRAGRTRRPTTGGPSC